MTDRSPESVRARTLSLLALTGDRGYSAIPHNVSMKGFVGPLVYAVAARCEARYRGVLTLLAADYQDEALVVLRSLINDAMRVEYLERNPATREANALWWWSSQIREFRKYAEAARHAGAGDWARATEAVATLHTEVLERQHSLGLRRLPPIPPEGRGLARELGQPLDELDYLRATLSSHSTLLAVLDHHVVSDDGTTTYLVRQDEVTRLIDIGHMAVDYYLRALIAAAGILGWPSLSDLLECRRAAETALSALQAESEGRVP